MDIALFRAAAPVPGQVVRARAPEDEESGPSLELLLDRPVRSVVRAVINDRDAKRVELHGEREVVITLPSSFARVPLSALSVSILAEQELRDLEGRTVPGFFGVGSSLSMTEGPSEAIQRAIRELMMSPGTDTWNRTRGAGLIAVRSYPLATEQELSRMVATSVSRFNTSRQQARAGRASYRVTRMEVQSVRRITAIEARRSLPAAPQGGTLLSSSERVLSATFRMTLSGPTQSSISSAVLV